jgi:hypothetical protein
LHDSSLRLKHGNASSTISSKKHLQSWQQPASCSEADLSIFWDEPGLGRAEKNLVISD